MAKQSVPRNIIFTRIVLIFFFPCPLVYEISTSLTKLSNTWFHLTLICFALFGLADEEKDADTKESFSMAATELAKSWSSTASEGLACWLAAVTGSAELLCLNFSSARAENNNTTNISRILKEREKINQPHCDKWNSFFLTHWAKNIHYSNLSFFFKLIHIQTIYDKGIYLIRKSKEIKMQKNTLFWEYFKTFNFLHICWTKPWW